MNNCMSSQQVDVILPIDKKKIIKAVEEAKKSSEKRKFKQSVELLLILKDIDLKKPENRINELIELPNSPGKPIRIGVFTTGDLAVRARLAKADVVLEKGDLIRLTDDKKKIKELVNSLDFFIAEAPLMPQIARSMGRVLGPRGKMPVPVLPTVSIDAVVKKHRKSVRIRVKDQLNVQCRVGAEDMPSENIADNVQAVIIGVENRLVKGLANIRRAYVKTTMGSLVEIEF